MIRNTRDLLRGVLPACALAALLGSARFAQAQSPGLQQAIATGVSIDQKLDAQLPLATPFQDETGKTVKIGDYFGEKPVIILMPFYRCAGMCTLELDGMAKAINAMKFTPGDEFNVVTISIDPRESYRLAQEKKTDYLSRLSPEKRAGADKGWHFLVGTEASILQVAQPIGFRYIIDPKTKQPIHAVGAMIFTPQGRVSRYLLGVDYSPRDMRLALVDASANKIGGLADKFTLLCSHFDPTTSKYGVAIDRIIKFSCSLTVLILGTFIFGMTRFEKRRAVEHAEFLKSALPPSKS